MKQLKDVKELKMGDIVRWINENGEIFLIMEDSDVLFDKYKCIQIKAIGLNTHAFPKDKIYNTDFFDIDEILS